MPEAGIAQILKVLQDNGIQLADIAPLLGQQGGGGGQFDLRALLQGAGGGPIGYAGQPIATPVGVGGGPLGGAEGQTFAPNVPFSGGAVFKPNETPDIIQNSLVLARNLSETIQALRRKREAAKMEAKANAQ